jgi:hypothetical protein
MDPDNALSSRREVRAHDVAIGFLHGILRRYAMARMWVFSLAEWNRFYRKEKIEYKKCGGKVSDSPKSAASDGGGGLEIYLQQFEKIHKEFGEMRSNESSSWANKDKDLADSRLPDEDSAERTLPPVSAIVTPEKEVVSDTRSDRPSLAAFTPVNQPVNSDDTRTPPNSHVPIYEVPVNNRPYQPVSASQYQIHTSPPNAPYPYGNPSQLQTTLSNSGQHSTALSGQPDAQTQNWHATRTAMEMNGYENLNNISSFGPLMLSDTSQFPGWAMVPDIPMYDSNNNTAYYPSAHGNNYQYQQ